MLNVFWFRRDLRLNDNAGLYHALSAGLPVLPVFIFDRHILEQLDDPSDARVTFIHDEVNRLKIKIEETGSSLWVKYGEPEDVFRELAATYRIDTVFTNHDYEPYARKRDQAVGEILSGQRIGFKTFKDQVIFEKNEVVKDSGAPYTVFTPFSKRWKSRFFETGLPDYPSERITQNYFQTAPFPMPGLDSMGFLRNSQVIPPRETDREVILNYHRTRDFPSIPGTSRLGVHLRFGTISIRQVVREAAGLNEVFLNELIWREFYMMILWHFPQVIHTSFRPQYDRIEWRNDERQFKAWCEGRTGYPIVDAGMRELNHTGYMHNRVRMITASFLTKHLLTDWRWGEAYFAKKLLDYELSSNNGGWQWAAGTGCDAAPYFRVFNPELQTEKFDREKKYILKWVPEYQSDQYTKRIVDHAEARKNAIAAYKKALE